MEKREVEDVIDLQHHSFDMMSLVLNGIQACVYAVDPSSYQIVFANKELYKLLPDLQDKDICYKKIWNKDEPCIHCPFRRLRAEKPSYHMEIFNDYLERWMSIDATYLQDKGHQKEMGVFIGYDISKQKSHENRLKKLAYYDRQSNIKNRFSFIEEVTAYYQEGKPGTAMIVSIKNFGRYNTAFGQKKGDELLFKIIEVLRTIYPTDKFYRISGTKFAFLFDTLSEAEKVINLIRKKKRLDYLDAATQFLAYYDIAVAQFPCFADSAEMLLYRLEYALKSTRDTEKSKVIHFNQVMMEKLERKEKITGVLKNALDEKNFEVLYQPIYHVESGKYTRCEALVRLRDEELGWVATSEFIPIAEEKGMINEIGHFVLEEICKKIHTRMKQGKSPVKFNVNVSTIEFLQTDFFEKTMELIGKYEIDTNLLCLEVTESIMINTFDYIVKLMKRFIREGISFSIDDFGSGYSGLNYIGRLPVSSIKLDKCFIDRIAHSDIYMLIVKNIIALAKGLKFQVVAEGVEDQAQFEILKRLGVDYIQGYLFSSALPNQELEEFLLNQEKAESLE